MSGLINKGIELALIVLLASGANGIAAQASDQAGTLPDMASHAQAKNGIEFSCAPQLFGVLRRDMAIYLNELGIEKHLLIPIDRRSKTLIYTLNTAQNDTGTLDFQHRKQYRIRDDLVRLPVKGGKTRAVSTVSKKEILLALLQHGRLTTFTGEACTLEALREHVAVRQNIVAWTDKLSWGWPDGEEAFWNTQFWDEGTPLASVSLDSALMDAFIHQEKYSIGCYTATKLSYAHAVLDYYTRIRKNTAKAALVRQRLLHDAEPLVGVEPAAMWDFERDFDKKTRDTPGKILSMQRGIAKDNFVPGDWIYLLNTHRPTYKKIGYEGSNAVYLGRGKFDDYYNDHEHSYTYAEKVNEVYQWRNGVFSRIRDASKIKPITDADVANLSETPANGGLLLSLRVAPYLFGYENLPELPAP
ncbi:MAG: hypothetical protein Q7T62_00555 [Undibacterium sp.]|nr:hypothetical protein [Undibacterium sp.]